MDVQHQVEMGLRLLFALILGAVIGSERYFHDKPAGARTHALVSLASALFMIVSIYGFSGFDHIPAVRRDPARLAAQVISGMGFLGAGVIWKEGINIKGLTTATTLWLVCGLGLASGSGMYIPAVLTTILAYVALYLFNFWEKTLLRKRNARTLLPWIEEFNITLLKKGMENIIKEQLSYDVSGQTENVVISFHLARQQKGTFLLTMGIKEDIVQIIFLLLPESLRGQGLGTLIIQLLINWSKENNLEKIFVTSTSETLNFWLSNGFKQIDEKTFVYLIANGSKTSSFFLREK
ncbi:MAG: GNAT family N-acetyltransferase [Dehalobacterium sp.]